MLNRKEKRAQRHYALMFQHKATRYVAEPLKTGLVIAGDLIYLCDIQDGWMDLRPGEHGPPAQMLEAVGVLCGWFIKNAAYYTGAAVDEGLRCSMRCRS